MTSATDLVDQLAAHRTVGAAPRTELEWLAAHGTLRQLKPGDLMVTRNGKVDDLFIVLSGHLAITVDRGDGPHVVMEWRGGDVTGVLPYSRLINSPGDSMAKEPSTILAVPRSHLRELVVECPEVTAMLVHAMLDRSKVFTTNDQQVEKMASLGKLSAGLAHELNNPASAIERSAALLERRLDEAEQAARAVGATRLTDTQMAAVDRVSMACVATRVHAVRSPIEQADREDAFADWLADRGLDSAGAEALAETALTFGELDALATSVDGPALSAVLRWVASGCSVRRLASEIQEAATRISGLVLAIKGFTHMDQATVAEPVDLIQGLDNTVAVLRAKARSKSAAVVVDVEPGLPRVRGFVGELNQVWSNLIDNALDAIPEGGRVEVRAVRERDRVVVRVVDNGSGIPDAIRERVFDPFFTTKPIGRGTGLGLDIVRRLVRHNEGDIVVESRVGRTEFRVQLPVADSDGSGARS